MLRSDSVWEMAALAPGSASLSGVLFILACLCVFRVTAYLPGCRRPKEAPRGGALCQLTYAYPLRPPQDQVPVFESHSPVSRR